MKPAKVLKRTVNYLKNFKELRTTVIKVGLPKEKATGKAYGEGGLSVIEVGAIHEYGTEHIPRRSWLRIPLSREYKDIDKMRTKLMQRIQDGSLTVDKAAILFGLQLEKICKNDISSEGNGTWPKSNRAVKQDGTTLYGTGTLRKSISSAVVSDQTK